MNSDALKNRIKSIAPLLKKIEDTGGIAYLVGGSIRDLVMQRPIFDIDIEVHQLTESQLIHCLHSIGKVHCVGKKFGVFRVGTIDIDWALPRTDSIGRKPEVSLDPFLGIVAALKRRDVRMNGMALKLTSNASDFGLSIKNIIDPFGGIHDINNKILRVIDAKLFVEDPLRIYRVIQYISRFALYPDQELTHLARSFSIIDPATQQQIAPERIGNELIKMLTLSEIPSLGFRWLENINRLEYFFPIFTTLSTKSRQKCFNTLDRAAYLYNQNTTNYANKSKNLLLPLFCLMFPDNTIKTISKQYGFGINNNDLKKLKIGLSLIKNTQKSQEYLYKKIAQILSPHWTLLDMLYLQNSIETTETLPEQILTAKKAGVLYSPLSPLLNGTDCIKKGFSGKEIGTLLEKAYEIQIQEGIMVKETLENKLEELQLFAKPIKK